MVQRVRTGRFPSPMQEPAPRSAFPLPQGNPLTVLIGREDALPAAHLLARVYEDCAAVGRITTEGCLSPGGALPPPLLPLDRALLEEEVRLLAAEGCERIVLAVSPKQLAAGALAGIPCGRAVVCNLRKHEADAVTRYLDACAAAVAVNLDDPAARAIAGRLTKRPLTYAEQRGEAELTGRAMTRRPAALRFEAVRGERIARVYLSYPGSYDLYTALAALAGAALDAVPLEAAARAVNAAPPVAGWYEPLRLPGGGRALICRHTLGRRTLERLLSLADLLEADGKQVTMLLASSGGRSLRTLRRQVGRRTGSVALWQAEELTAEGAGNPLLRRCVPARGEAEWLLCGGPVDWETLLGAADARKPGKLRN